MSRFRVFKNVNGRWTVYLHAHKNDAAPAYVSTHESWQDAAAAVKTADGDGFFVGYPTAYEVLRNTVLTGVRRPR